MTENLRTTKDNSGNTVTYFLPNNDQQSVSEYGLLYDFATACKVCPEGWVLPDNEDWQQLIDANGGEQAAAAFKDAGSWEEEAGAEGIGFLVRPAGYGNSGEHHNLFGEKGILWSKSASEEFGWTFLFEKNKNKIRKAEQHSSYGFSVRCIKNKP